MFGLIAVILVGTLIIILGVVVVWQETKNHVFLLFCLIVGLFATSFGFFELGEEMRGGAPLRTIEPGKYMIEGVVKDESFVTDQSSRTLLIAKKSTEKDAKFYALPTNELGGTPKEGQHLEVFEIPASKKMMLVK
ncbi:hypothetical protein HY839_03985 [Candidatus Azambacteria bacterium]|nr:hypothetical protein [Candidatus Azambacteria bacterium]